MPYTQDKAGLKFVIKWTTFWRLWAETTDIAYCNLKHIMKSICFVTQWEEDYVPEYKLVTKPRSQGQSVSPPNVLAGSKSRLKVLVFDKYPSREIGNLKLPKGETVMLCFFYHLLQDPDRASNPNKWILASDKAAIAAGYKTVERSQKTGGSQEKVWSKLCHEICQRFGLDRLRILWQCFSEPVMYFG